jgi:hypothetical protein
MRPARTHTYPICRPPMHAACRHERLWEYRHTSVRESDLPMIAKAFGISESEILETAESVGSAWQC